MPNAPVPTLDRWVCRSFDQCLQEHHRTLKSGDLASSTLAKHTFSSDHQVDLSKAMVIVAHAHPHPDSLHGRVLAYPASTVTGAPCQAVCYIAGLTMLLTCLYFIHYYYQLLLSLPLHYISCIFSFVSFASSFHHLLYFPLYSSLPVLVYLMGQHHHLILHLHIHTCKCQLFTDEGRRRLPKCLN